MKKFKFRNLLLIYFLISLVLLLAKLSFFDKQSNSQAGQRLSELTRERDSNKNSKVPVGRLRLIEDESAEHIRRYKQKASSDELSIESYWKPVEGKISNVYSDGSIDIELDPSIWFQDESGRYFVVVRAARYPETDISLPRNIDDIKRGCSKMADSGYFAPVILASSQDPFDHEAKSNGNFLPLYRGHGMLPKYPGLTAL